MSDLIDTNLVWVDNPKLLARMADDLLKSPIIAVDTESNSLYVYREQVCLIQISTDETDYLVDPFALPDLSLLQPVFQNEHLEKVFHASEYDIICLKRDFGFKFQNIFDTMIAGRILGKTQLGLSSMLKEELGVEINKKYQRANWGKRPLSQALLEYARQDSHYLIPLRNKIKSMLEAADRMDLAEEDFRRFCETEASPVNYEDDNIWRISGNTPISPQQASILRQLSIYRNQQAESADLPLFKVISNEQLLDIALYTPQTKDDLFRIRGLSPRLIEQHSDGLLKAIKIGMNSSPLYRPPCDRNPLRYNTCYETLKMWRKQTAQRLTVESDVVLPKDIMITIAEKSPRSLSELHQIMTDVPWRWQHFGSEILEIIHTTETT